MRLQGDKIVKQTVKWNPNGSRKCERPNITWNKRVRINTEKRSTNNEECLDQDMWKREVSGL
jgi:hypothetical protein